MVLVLLVGYVLSDAVIQIWILYTYFQHNLNSCIPGME